MKNERGPIAEAYDDLQGLPALREAQASFSDHLTDPQSVDNTLAQCADILLCNLTELLTRTGTSAEQGDWASATLKLEWAIDFSRTLYSVTASALQNWRVHPHVHRFTLEDSNSLAPFLAAISALEEKLESSVPTLEQVFTEAGRSDCLAFLDAYLVLSHEWLMVSDTVLQWEDPGQRRRSPLAGEAPLHRALAQPHLSGDTFFQQFRACHQVPELLIWTANQFYLEAVERSLIGDISQACNSMSSGNELLELAQKATFPLVRNLQYRDYHRLRENLGMTSGSHSQAIHVVLLTALQNDVASLLSAHAADTPEKQLLRHLCARFLSLTQAWRNMHSLLPKRNLGVSGTRSLIGAPEAAAIVEQLRRKPLPPPDSSSRLTAFLADPSRFNARILASLGLITNSSFPDVQQRTGFFGPATQRRKESHTPETK